MRFLISGYYGYDNAGDEAVLAALLDHISSQRSDAEFTVTSGDPSHTATRHAAEYSLRAIAREDFKTLWREIKSCDAFISGGGSLLQDATSLRNIIYYTALIRMAHAAKKPAMIYAQGIGPLNRSISQKLTRAAMQSRRTRIVTLRDPDSKALLNSIGVTREIEITADPVWALTGSREPEAGSRNMNIWCVSLRSWPGESTPDAEAKLLQAIRDAALSHHATLKFLAMQPARDRALMESLGVAREEILETENLHPREIMQLAAQSTLMIAMRLHALIFAAAQGVPCVAVSYDPKVKSLAKLIGAPAIENARESELAKLQAAATQAGPPDASLIELMKTKALRNAELAANLV